MSTGQKAKQIAEVAFTLHVTKEIAARLFVQDGFRIEFYLDGVRIWDETADRDLRHKIRSNGFQFAFEFRTSGSPALRCDVCDQFYPNNRATFDVLRESDGSLDVAFNDRGHRFVKLL